MNWFILMLESNSSNSLWLPRVSYGKKKKKKPEEPLPEVTLKESLENVLSVAI